jgi:hypothetical protein
MIIGRKITIMQFNMFDRSGLDKMADEKHTKIPILRNSTQFPSYITITVNYFVF